MTPEERYTRLRELGLSARTDGRSVILSPRAAVTDEAAALVRADKPALIAWLRHREEVEGALDALGGHGPGWPPEPAWLLIWPGGGVRAVGEAALLGLEVMRARGRDRRAVRRQERQDQEREAARAAARARGRAGPSLFE